MEDFPLLIKTLNNQQKAGGKRDCLIVNPRMTDAKMLKAFQFIGAMIGQRFERGPNYYAMNQPYAPTFWKQVLNEPMSLEDFAIENNQLMTRLNNLEQNVGAGNETFSWTDQFGVVKNIPGQPHGKLVTEENLEEFKAALLQAYINEVAPQMEAVRTGFKHIMNNKSN